MDLGEDGLGGDDQANGDGPRDRSTAGCRAPCCAVIRLCEGLGPGLGNIGWLGHGLAASGS